MSVIRSVFTLIRKNRSRTVRMPVFISWKPPTVRSGKFDDGKKTCKVKTRNRIITDYRFGDGCDVSYRLGRDELSRHPVCLESRDGKASIALAVVAVKPLRRAALGRLENLAKSETSGGISHNAEADDGGQPVVYPAG
ncbi:hypothetical protein XCR1_1940002 [Xenorhabdus cabanillasii JM26]|uniref:Uncharacterized protein n=1 Tax=Xenorhabdus cabanillasii JM26 TaxID=1427517 RepID=W1J4X7_9GAMM|nr:hypothetical protein XCR1_1940002 [Xenorhabdus cabanillasii JM26]